MGGCSKEVSFQPHHSYSNTLLQVKEETWLDYQEIQDTLLCERVCTEDTLSWTIKKHYPVVQWDTVRIILIFHCFIGLNSQIIDFTNAFSQSGITVQEQLFIGVIRYFKNYGEQYDNVIRLN